MALTIQLSAAEQARLDNAAKREGLAPEELARKVLTDHLPPVHEELQREEATLALFREWEKEGTARTVEDAERENELWERFQANLNETRAALGMRRL